MLLKELSAGVGLDLKLGKLGGRLSFEFLTFVANDAKRNKNLQQPAQHARLEY